MTPDPHAPVPDDHHDHPGDADPNAADTELALYALDALEEDEARTVETRLATEATAAAVEGRLRRASGAVAAAADGIDAAPPASLRDRVLAAARAERAPTVADLEPTPPAALHRLEGERLVALLRSLPAEDWDAPVDPPEFAGWTVGDVVAHVATVEAYLAQQLGIDGLDAPEPHPDNDDRTTAARDRHRHLSRADAIAEVEVFLTAVDDDVATLGDPAARTTVWWGTESPVDRVLVVRSFELWVHAADIARAVGRPEPVPSAPSLRTMSTVGVSLAPVMCAVTGTLAADATERWIRFELDGPGGATHDVPLSIGGPAPTGEPDATLALDIVDFCRAVAKRLDPSSLPHRATGDRELAAAVVAALPALAVL